MPTAAARNGDLSSLLGDYVCAGGTVSSTPCANPVTVQTTEGATVPARAGMVFDPNSGDPATGAGRRAFSQNGVLNQIPVAAPMQKLLGNLPLPNNGTDIFNNYTAGMSEAFDSDQYDGRVDYNWSTSSHAFARYTLADFNKLSPGAFGALAGGPSAFGFAGQADTRNQSVAIGLDHAFGPTLIADARLGFYRYRVRVQPNGVGQEPATEAGLPGLNAGSPETSGMPAFYINGNGGFNFGYALGVNQCNCPLKQTENHFQYVTNWTKQLGNHSIKFGADVRRAQQQRIPSDSHRSGEIYFNDSVTGNPDVDAIASGQATTGAALASYLLGQPNYFARYFTGVGYYPGLRQTRVFLYAQDQWRITPKLTLNYGLRWEDYLPQTAAKPGGAGSFDPATGEVLAAGIGSVPLNMGVESYNLGFAPRIGIAYQFTPHTVVRTGYGRSFNPSGLGAVFGQGADYNPPIVNPQSVPQANPYVPAFNLLNGPPAVPNPPVGSNGRYPLPNGISVYYFTDPANSYRIPLADFWNFTIQHEFASDFAAEVAYVGNVGRHLFLSLNRNQAVPGPGNYDPRRPLFQKFGLEQGVYQTCNCDNSSYNALQAKLQKRMSRGLDFLLTYTYGKAMGTRRVPADSRTITTSGTATDRCRGIAPTRSRSRITWIFRSATGGTMKWAAAARQTWRLVDGGSAASHVRLGTAFYPDRIERASPERRLQLRARGHHRRPECEQPVREPLVQPGCIHGAAGPLPEWHLIAGNSLRGPNLYNSDLSLAKNFGLRKASSSSFAGRFSTPSTM